MRGLFLLSSAFLLASGSARMHQERQPSEQVLPILADVPDLSTSPFANDTLAIQSPAGSYFEARARRYAEKLRQARQLKQKKKVKRARCRARKPRKSATPTPDAVKETAEASKPTRAAVVAAAVVAAVPEKEDEKTTTKKPEKAAATPANSGASSSGSGGLFGFSTSNCGDSGATDRDPNGSESFLNCGLSASNRDSPWSPPQGVTLDKLKTVSIEEALAKNSVWKPCEKYISLFEKYGAETGLPPIMLAAIALQESTCNAEVLGDNGGAFGLMQITQDKCNGMGKEGCSSPDYNILTGAKYLANEIKVAGGNVLQALGQYNGWRVGMTYNSATAAANSGCCHCQNNIDYLYQMLNGWLLGKTGYELGSADNLAVCG